MEFVDNSACRFLLTNHHSLLITILKIHQTLFVFPVRVLDYNFVRYKQEILLKFYLKL